MHTGVVSGVAAGADTGRLSVVPVEGRTLVHAGAAVGRGVWVDQLEGATGPVVALVRSGTGYAEAAAAVNRAAADVVAVALADDEAVLVGNRLESRVPVLDQVPVERLAAASRVALEVAPPGGALARVVDPLWLSSELGLDAADRSLAATAASQLAGRSSGLVLLETSPAASACHAGRSVRGGAGRGTAGASPTPARRTPTWRSSTSPRPRGRASPATIGWPRRTSPARSRRSTRPPRSPSGSASRSSW